MFTVELYNGMHEYVQCYNLLVLQVGGSLSQLCLAGCGIDDLQLSALSQSFSSCTLLKELCLSRNDITLSGAEALVRFALL